MSRFSELSCARYLRRARSIRSLSRVAIFLVVAAIAGLPSGSAIAAGPAQIAARAASTQLPTLEGPDGEALPFETHAEVRDFLRRAEIVESEELDTGSTVPLRITLRSEGVTARAIFRHIDERRDRIRLAEGPTYMRFYDTAIAEVAAYELGLLLGIDNIPPAVVRGVDGRRGTVQIWIEDAVTDSDRIVDELTPEDYSRWVRQRADMKVFDALVYNADRNTGNVLYDARWNLWMIDHTRTFQRPTEPVDLSDVNRITRHLWDRLREIDPEAMRSVLDPYLEPLQVDALLDRHQAILEHFRQRIRERGVGAVVLSSTGPDEP